MLKLVRKITVHHSNVSLRPQTYFRLSLLSERREISDDRKYVCGGRLSNVRCYNYQLTHNQSSIYPWLGLMIRFRAFSALLSYSANEATSTFCPHVLCSFNHWLSNEQTFSQNCKRFRELLASELRRDESEAVDQFSMYPKAVTSLSTNISKQQYPLPSRMFF